jgi:DNA-binding transcriptional ArsR family regulator
MYKYSTNWLTLVVVLLIFNHMVDIHEPQLDAVFHALGDPTRRMMLRRLVQGEQTVGQLAEPFSMSLAAASKHIKALESAGLISREVLGRTHVCHLNAGPLRVADEWLRYYESVWTARLDRLEELLRRDSATTPNTPAAKPRGKQPRAGQATPSPRRNRRTR